MAAGRLEHNVSPACLVWLSGTRPFRAIVHTASFLLRVMADSASLPTYSQIRSDTERLFHKIRRISQMQAAVAQMERRSDVIYIAGTGSGKTLTFWMPIIYEKDSITILVTPLNILGDQTAEWLNDLGIHSISLTAGTANFKANLPACICVLGAKIIYSFRTSSRENTISLSQVPNSLFIIQVLRNAGRPRLLFNA